MHFFFFEDILLTVLDDSYTILNDLNAAGYISAQSDPNVANVQSWLQFNYSRNQEPEPEAMEPGTFT